MARGGYYHGDEYIEYKDGNLAGVYGSSSNRNAKRRSVYNSGNYNKSNNYTYQDYERNHPDRLVCRVCGSVYNKYKYTRCPHCYPESSKGNRQYNIKSNDSSLTTCPTCGRKIIAGSLCPLCHITCQKCGKRYNKHSNSNCPYCKASKPKPKPKISKSKYSNKSNYKTNWSYTSNYDKNERNKHRVNENNRKSGNDNFILGCCIGLIILFLMFAIL